MADQCSVTCRGLDWPSEDAWARKTRNLREPDGSDFASWTRGWLTVSLVPVITQLSSTVAPKPGWQLGSVDTQTAGCTPGLPFQGPT